MMNEKILIVDDQYGIRILLNEVFHKEGYQTFQAANGIQALDIVTKERPDLVLYAVGGLKRLVPFFMKHFIEQYAYTVLVIYD